MLNLQKCIERTDLEITMPDAGLQTDRFDVAGTSSAVLTGSGLSRPNKQLPNEQNIPNLLNTIQEESAFDNRFLENEDIVASTPLVSNIPGLQLSASLLEEEEEATDPSLVIPPRKQTSTPKRSSNLPRTSTQRIYDETSSEEELKLDEIDQKIRQNVTQRPNVTQRQNVTVISCEVLEVTEESREVEATEEAEESLADLSVTNFPLKELHINMTKTQIPSAAIKQYKEAFIASHSIADVSKENEREESVETTTSATSTSTTRGRRKRAMSVDAPRRSTGRPKRKARQLVASLAEGPLNRKMRRSK